jgi:hypothetical protein
MRQTGPFPRAIRGERLGMGGARRRTRVCTTHPIVTFLPSPRARGRVRGPQEKARPRPNRRATIPQHVGSHYFGRNHPKLPPPKKPSIPFFGTLQEENR